MRKFTENKFNDFKNRALMKTSGFVVIHNIKSKLEGARLCASCARRLRSGNTDGSGNNGDYYQKAFETCIAEIEQATGTVW